MRLSPHFTMKLLKSTTTVKIPEDVTCTVKNGTVTIKGPRGKLVRVFKPAGGLTMTRYKGKLEITKYWGKRRENAVCRSIGSHIHNMITGVTEGFRYKMRSVYAHFPINVLMKENGSLVEIRNFMGEKKVRRVRMKDGVTCFTGDQKDELVLEGNDVELVSNSAALIQQSTTVKNKDLRKFLDGVYVSEKNTQ